MNFARQITDAATTGDPADENRRLRDAVDQLVNAESRAFTRARAENLRLASEVDDLRHRLSLAERELKRAERELRELRRKKAA